MPVLGLPSTLECLLNALLCESTVSSFKIDGKGDNTVVVLRLSPNISFRPPVTADSSSIVYRRKCPSQMRRDKRRAEMHRAEMKASVSSPSGLFLPTPPSLSYATDPQETESSVTDHFSFTPCIPSLQLTSNNPPLEKQQIDLSVSDDTQTVTVDRSFSGHSDDVVLCELEQDGESEGEETNETDAKCVVSDTDAEGAEVDDQSDIDCSHLVECLKEFYDNTSKNMDSLLQEITATRKTVKYGNLDRGVS